MVDNLITRKDSMRLNNHAPDHPSKVTNQKLHQVNHVERNKSRIRHVSIETNESQNEVSPPRKVLKKPVQDPTKINKDIHNVTSGNMKGTMAHDSEKKQQFR